MASPPSIDWNKKENARNHHTDRYPGTELVVRRGKESKIVLNFHGSPPPATNLKFTVATGSTPELQQRTRVEFGVSSAPPPGSWGAVQTSHTKTTLGFSISSPANAIVGRYWLSIKTSSSSPISQLGTFVLLFNPWLPGDDVYMPTDAERAEYVLSTFGLLFRGVPERITSLGWNFGQFQEDILNICLSILDQSSYYRRDPIADVLHRNDPKYVARVLSATVNNGTDGYGVLEGNWSGDYTGGVKPGSWNGSAAILKQWKKSGFQPVKYGQCWVFAGLLTTVLRCLGIPSRPVTNYKSGHDGNIDLILDIYYDTKGNRLPDKSPDSIWNYHVWTESWFARTDLGTTHTGWQTLDGTPQEISEGIYQCGPASLTAIKKGDVDLKYDGPFVFAEVDARVLKWEFDASTGRSTPIYHKTIIGQSISTKATGSDNRQDVTGSYKHPAGSPEERAAYANARKKLPPRMLEAEELQAEPPVVSGEFRVDGPLEVGKDVSLTLTLKSLAPSAKNMTVNMAAWTIIYTGKPIYEVWKESRQVTLAPSEAKTLPIKISYAAYKQHLTGDNMIQVTAFCQVDDGSLALFEKVIVLSNPHITMKVLGPVKVGKEVEVEVTFASPPEEELRDCVLHAEGSDLLVETLKLEAAPLRAKESSPLHFTITPSQSGTKHLIVNFSCDKYKNITIFETIAVED